jgi:hypothetical protein
MMFTLEQTTSGRMAFGNNEEYVQAFAEFYFTKRKYTPVEGGLYWLTFQHPIHDTIHVISNSAEALNSWARRINREYEPVVRNQYGARYNSKSKEFV